MPFHKQREGLLSVIVIASVLAGGCDPPQGPEAPSAFLTSPKPTSPPPPPPIPTPFPAEAPAPPPAQLALFLGQWTESDPPQITLYRLAPTSTHLGGARFHGWRIRTTRVLSPVSGARVLKWLTTHSTYSFNECLCSYDPDFGIRISRGGRHLDLTLDSWTLSVADFDDHRTINELAHDSFFRALEQAIRGGA